ncbi:MAG: DMT family transporter [Pseudomonadota bacterium]
MQSDSRPLAGISMLLVALFLFSIQDIVIKSFSGHYSVLQIVYVRCIVGLSLLFFLLGLRRTIRLSRSKRPTLAFARGLLGFTSYLGYYMAMASLPLAELVSIVFTAPIFVTVLSALLLREKVGVRRWSAVMVGFIGVLIVVGPEGLSGNLAVILAFGAALTYACSTILTRFLSPHDEPITISLYSMVMFVVGSVVISVAIGFSGDNAVTHPSLQFLLRDWAMPTAIDLSLMVFIGAIWSMGMYLLARSYCVAPASLLSPFEFTYIIWAVIFGYFFWHEIPTATTIAGVALLIGSSIYIAHREVIVSQRHGLEDEQTAQNLPASLRQPAA